MPSPLNKSERPVSRQLDSPPVVCRTASLLVSCGKYYMMAGDPLPRRANRYTLFDVSRSSSPCTAVKGPLRDARREAISRLMVKRKQEEEIKWEIKWITRVMGLTRRELSHRRARPSRSARAACFRMLVRGAAPPASDERARDQETDVVAGIGTASPVWCRPP